MAAWGSGAGEWRREIGEPLSWVLAIAAMTFALRGIDALKPSILEDPFFHGIIVGFTVHELAHRQVGRRYRMVAEFVATPLGLAITAITGLIPGIAILIPGYVKTMVLGALHPRGVYYAVAAGPASNIVIAAAAWVASGMLEGDPAVYVAAFGKVNAFLALFNLLPLAPLDGEKILRYNPVHWVLLIAASGILYVSL